MLEHEETRTESYLVRLSRDSHSGAWRASLQNVRTGEVTCFARPVQLWAYLQAEMARPEAAGRGR